MPPEKVETPPTKRAVPEWPAEIVPLLVMPLEKVEIFSTSDALFARRKRTAVGDAAREGRDVSGTLTGLAAEIVLLLTMLPEKTETLSTEMPEAE